MNYNSLMNKPTINYRELIGDNSVTEVGGITEEQFNTLLNTDLSSYYTKAQIDDLFSRSFVYREKSGSIVTFDCPASVNGIDKVVSEIVAVQSGTGDPSPTNIRPITGWSEVNVTRSRKNLLNTSNIYLSGYGINAEGEIIASENYNLYRFRADDNTSYTVAIDDTTGSQNRGLRLAFYNANNGLVSLAGGQYQPIGERVTFTIQGQSGVEYLYISVRNSAYNVQLEIGDTETTYEAFSGTTTPIQFTVGGETKTIYSGHVEIKNGKVKAVANLERVDLGSLSWVRNTSTYDYAYFYSNVIDVMKESASNVMIDRYNYVGARNKLTENNTCGYYNNRVCIRDDSFEDATALKTYLTDNSIFALVTLATPIEYDLADVSISTQDGTNNIWCDTGDITVKALDKIIQG